MKLLPLPVALPGKCIICGASDNDDGRQYIDIGFEIDFYGVIYFCSHCMSEAAVAIGYRSPSLFQVIDDENKSLLKEFAELSAENVKLRVALNQLDFLGSNDSANNVGVNTKEPVKQKRPDNHKPAKQINEPRPTNVSKTGNDDLGDFEDF